MNTTKKRATKKSQEIKDVQPIRTKKDIDNMKWALKRHCSERDYIMFLIGINTGLRITDLLELKIEDVKGKKKLIIKEGKTNKPRQIQLTNIYKEVQDYIKTLSKPSGWLFPSREGDKRITRIQAYNVLKKAAQWAEIESVGTHTMRKTFGYWYYKKTMDIAKLQEILNHSKPEVTKRYIGITAEEIEDSLNDFVL